MLNRIVLLKVLEILKKKVVEHVTSAASCGFSKTRQVLFLRTGRLCQKMGTKTHFKADLLGQAYSQGLKQWRPTIDLRKPEQLGTSRARMHNPTVVNKYVNDLGKIINDLNLTEKAKKIWSMDGTGNNPSIILSESQRLKEHTRKNFNPENKHSSSC